MLTKTNNIEELSNYNHHKLIVLLGITLFMLIYSIHFGSVYATIYESGNNSSYKNADEIKIGEMVYGSMLDYDEDHDWFIFKAPISGKVKITVWNDKHSEADAIAYVYNYNDRYSVLASPQIESGCSRSEVFSVVSGKRYYVNMWDQYTHYPKEYHFKLTYVIDKSSITKTKPLKAGFKLTFKKNGKASFYQVRYTKKSVYGDYRWNKAKIMKINRKNSSCSVKKLKKKCKYYAQIRVARTIDGITYYSNWSSKKMIKTL